MIEVKHLDKFFDNGTRQVLHDISASLSARCGSFW